MNPNSRPRSRFWLWLCIINLAFYTFVSIGKADRATKHVAALRSELAALKHQAQGKQHLLSERTE